MINIDEKFSYSKLETFCNCGFAFYLKYREFHNSFTANISTEIGTLVHETEENIAIAIRDKKEINYTELIKNFVAKLKEIHTKYPKDFDTLDKANRTYTEKANYYLNEGIFRLEQYMKEHPSYEIVGIEQSFDFIYKDKYRFHGFIDRVFRDTKTNKYIIQDIKTYAKPIDKASLTTPLQMLVYSFAATKLWNINFDQIECEYYIPFLPSDTNIVAGLTQKAGTKGFIDRGVKKLNGIFDKIEKDDFAVNPSPLCFWCPFSRTNPNALDSEKMLCPYHSNWTKDNKDYNAEYEWTGMQDYKKLLEHYKK